MQLIHIVRRYGPVGGMERYVWELTLNLRALGHEVLVLCEVCTGEKPDGVSVIELGEIRPRPRWLALWRFGRRVAHWLAEHPHAGSIIHSHERSSCHQVTTFHGPPFATVLDKPWWCLLSLRIWMQLFLERRELATAQFIVPNSPIIQQQLAHYYPKLAFKLTEPIAPGVGELAQRVFHKVPADGGVIGFVGKEWKRKGLPLAVQAVAQLRRTRPNLQLQVIGPEAAEIQYLFAGWTGGYRLLGWSNMAHYADFDVLLHPAKAEPYGMVISEAMAAGVPVVVSEVCGAAAQVATDAGTVLPLSAPVEVWSEALEAQLSRNEPVPHFVRSWKQVAQEFEKIYNKVKP
ncbi:MAG: glycosyltransferase family 4 protein [Methylophilaceae bacterium]|nr:glycosyltransferase family 4 protein [Methylophilaceae bacterium]